MPRPLSWLPRLHEISRSVANSVRSHYDRHDLQRPVRAPAPRRPEAAGNAPQRSGRDLPAGRPPGAQYLLGPGARRRRRDRSVRAGPEGEGGGFAPEDPFAGAAGYRAGLPRFATSFGRALPRAGWRSASPRWSSWRKACSRSRGCWIPIPKWRSLRCAWSRNGRHLNRETSARFGPCSRNWSGWKPKPVQSATSRSRSHPEKEAVLRVNAAPRS